MSMPRTGGSAPDNSGTGPGFFRGPPGPSGRPYRPTPYIKIRDANNINPNTNSRFSGIDAGRDQSKFKY